MYSFPIEFQLIMLEMFLNYLVNKNIIYCLTSFLQNV